jgi:hypothetical protein
MEGRELVDVADEGGDGGVAMGGRGSHHQGNMLMRSLISHHLQLLRISSFGHRHQTDFPAQI